MNHEQIKAALILASCVLTVIVVLFLCRGASNF